MDKKQGHDSGPNNRIDHILKFRPPDEIEGSYSGGLKKEKKACDRQEEKKIDEDGFGQ